MRNYIGVIHKEADSDFGAASSQAQPAEVAVSARRWSFAREGAMRSALRPMSLINPLPIGGLNVRFAPRARLRDLTRWVKAHKRS